MSIINGQDLDFEKIEVLIEAVASTNPNSPFHITMVYSYDSHGNQDFYPHLTFTEQFAHEEDILNFITDQLPVEEDIITLIK